MASYAWHLFLASIPATGGEPTLSPERAQTLAREFIEEAVRRGL
jgi:pyruvate-formate lyase-activating enzyme